ncbi:MAG TPA: glycosyltransferase family 4 protein [Bryobacteraceae bacterium]|jgi:glycosyltransferase involved in cell wall biosynthesis
MIRLGVIADEFFDHSLGRMGGFGWAARQVAQAFADPALGVEVVYLAGELRAEPGRDEARAHGCRVLLRRSTRLANLRMVRRERFDVLLTIDYNLSHSVYLRSLPRTPAIVWVRDPRTPDDVRKVYSLKIPGAGGETPQGLECIDCRSAAQIAREAAWFGRPLSFASPAPHLVAKLEDAYGFEPYDFYVLPNAIEFEREADKSGRPTVVFLGRLDPIKRPWLFAELARRFPEVEFLFLGQPHFAGPGAWHPDGLPANVRLLGHVGETDKKRILSEAWVAVNTSIHEGLAISFLEALACETPLLTCQDPGFVVSRYGIYTGRFDGDGMASLDAFECGLRTLLADAEMRASLGASGRAWVRANHTRERFVESFFRLCRLGGVAP